LNELLEAAGFDEFVEGLCARFYHARLGRPSLRPGVYFRALLVGYFEGIDSERGIAWRVADSLPLRRFLLIGLDERTPDHSTISRTRRLIDIDTHREVFSWVLGLLAEGGLLKRQRMGIDATTLEANAAMRSIVRRDTGRIVAVTLQAADQGDTKTLDETLCEAGEQVAEQIGREAELRPRHRGANCCDPETSSYENAINPTREFLYVGMLASFGRGWTRRGSRRGFHSRAPLEERLKRTVD